MRRGRLVTAVIFTVALTLALCVLALAGCGSKTEEAPVGNTGTPQGDAAQLASCQANLRTIDAAIATYQAGTGKLPTSLQALVPTYLRAAPQEPMGGSYSVSGGKATCSLGHKY
jgi:hypothetical protein